MREMKDSGIEWIGEIPSEWKLSKIKYVADFVATWDYKGKDIKNETLITYLPMECIKNGWFENKAACYGDLPPSLTKFIENDICMAKVTPCFENGNIAIMKNLHNNVGMGSSELFVIRAKDIDRRYLFYWLQNSKFVQQACSTMTGTGGLKRVSGYFVKNCYIHCPSIMEQHIIGGWLDLKCTELDDIYGDVQAEIETLEEYKKSVIAEAVTKGLDKNVAMKDSGMAWIPKLPAHWEIIPSKYLFKNMDGRKRQGDEQLTASQKYGIITQAEYMERENAKVVLATQKLDDWKHVEPNDFVISLRSFQGGLEMSEISGCITWHYVVLRAMQKIYPRFYKWLFKSSQYINALQGTCNFIRDGQDLRYSNFSQVPLYIPPFHEQEAIAQYLDDKCREIETIISQKQEQLAVLADYKQSLIYEYVTGKKEVPVA